MCAGQKADTAPVWSLAEPSGQDTLQSALQTHSWPLIFDSQALQQVTHILWKLLLPHPLHRKLSSARLPVCAASSEALHTTESSASHGA